MDSIKPIRTDEEHAEVLREIEALWDAEPGSPRHDRSEVLGILASAYEETRWPMDPPDPVEAIRFHMEQNGHAQADLARLLGSRSRASEILSRRRHLTLEMAWRLSQEWKIPAESLLRPYPLATSSAA